MSRKTSGSRASFSPTQRKACAVLAVCVLAVILTFIASWVLPGKLSLGGSGRYDPQAYPLDTSLGSVLAGIVSVGSTTVCLLHGGKKHIRHVGRQHPGRLQLLHRGKGGGSAGWS